MYRSLQNVANSDIPLQRLIGTIHYLSEMLALYAQMAAATGDASWEKRYREMEPRLDAAIVEVATLAREEYHQNYASQTKLAYSRLIEMESLAFALVRSDRSEEASDLLLGPEYAEQKARYTEGVTKLTDAIQRRISLQVNQFRRYLGFVGAFAVVSVAMLLVAWIAVSVSLKLHLSHRKRFEEDLAAEKERLAVTLGSIGDGVIATDAAGRVTMMNAVAEELTGWLELTAVGKAVNDVFFIINEKTRERCENPVAKVLATGMVCGLANHTVLVAKDGRERIIADSGSPIRDRMGTTVGVVLVFRDITAATRLEQEVLKAEKLESVGILAGGIAHDFNNILTGILGNITLARMRVDSDEKASERLAEAEKACQRARDLTRQLLTFSRGGEPVRRPTCLRQLLFDWVGFALRGSNVCAEFDIPQALWPVDIDEGQISQVINNLVINADQAMPEGGTVHVTAENLELEESNGLSLAVGNYVRLAVRDEGIGISSENLNKIFDPYFTTKPKGVGLGLASSYAAVKRHDGLITAESRVGIGTVFYVYLPASKVQARPLQIGRQPATLGCGRILVMDDEELVRELATEMLKNLGYQPVQAEDGQQAVHAYQRSATDGTPFDAVILDLTIPGGIGGVEALKALRSLNPALKAIVSSGYSNDPVMAEFRTYGFNGVLVKPYSLAAMSEVLQHVIKGQNGMDATITTTESSLLLNHELACGSS
jgi:PAS domain S-box-containing protein